jgi:hypothetical protein
MKFSLPLSVLLLLLFHISDAVPKLRFKQQDLDEKPTVFKISLDRTEVSADAKSKFLQKLTNTHKFLTRDYTNSSITTSPSSSIHELKLGNYKNAQVT